MIKREVFEKDGIRPEERKKFRPPSMMEIVRFIKEQPKYRHSYRIICEKLLGKVYDGPKYPQEHTKIWINIRNAQNFMEDKHHIIFKEIMKNNEIVYQIKEDGI